MIIYLAGRGHGAPSMPQRNNYEHVLFSFYEYSRRNYRWLKRRKAIQQTKRKKK